MNRNLFKMSCTLLALVGLSGFATSEAFASTVRIFSNFGSVSNFTTSGASAPAQTTVASVNVSVLPGTGAAVKLDATVTATFNLNANTRCYFTGRIIDADGFVLSTNPMISAELAGTQFQKVTIPMTGVDRPPANTLQTYRVTIQPSQSSGSTCSFLSGASKAAEAEITAVMAVD